MAGPGLSGTSTAERVSRDGKRLGPSRHQTKVGKPLERSAGCWVEELPSVL
jgi:hypothetical protein